MSLPKCVLLIMSCEKYSHKAAAQKATWLKRVPNWLTWWHVIGDTNLTNPFVFDTKSRTLRVSAPDDYVSLPQKVIAAFDAIYKTHNEIDFIFKTDDDQNCVTTDIFTVLRNILWQCKIHYAGNVVDVKVPHISQYWRLHPELSRDLTIDSGKYCSGRFYILSRAAILHLLQFKRAFKDESLEDYAIGKFLSDEFKTDTALRHLAVNSWFCDN